MAEGAVNNDAWDLYTGFGPAWHFRPSGRWDFHEHETKDSVFETLWKQANEGSELVK